MGLNLRIPSHVSLRWWICKSGYYRIETKPVERLAYVVYVDESIVMGGQKLLLVLGILESSIGYNKGLDFSQMDVLWVGSGGSWKGETISKVLQEINQKYALSYVVSGNGTNLRRAYELSNCVHVEDCTHCLAGILKGIYQDDTVFESFSKSANSLRTHWFLSKEKSVYLPPTQRGKVRFATIFPVVEWAQKWINQWTEIPPEVQQDLVFLMESKALIAQLANLQNTVSALC